MRRQFQPCRKQSRPRPGHAGSTMVEVMVSFAVFVMVISMFSQVFLLCSRLTVQSTDAMKEAAQFYEDYYLGEHIRTEEIGGGTVLFKLLDEREESSEDEFVTVSGMTVYRHTSTKGLRGAIYDVR